MPLDYELIGRCLDELERELLRIGRERCNFLHDENSLSAVILLLLRCVSLFRAMLGEFRSESLDAFDAVRRAFLESWHLAFQFRMQNLGGVVGRWFVRMPESWRANIGGLDDYARARGHGAPNLGRDYGELSGLAHPTRDAAENSAALVTRRLRLNVDAQTVEQAIAALEAGIPAMLCRFAWLVLDEHGDLLPLRVEERNMPTVVQFAENFPGLEP